MAELNPNNDECIKTSEIDDLDAEIEDLTNKIEKININPSQILINIIKIQNHNGLIENLLHDGVSYYGTSLGYDYSYINEYIVKRPWEKIFQDIGFHNIFDLYENKGLIDMYPIIIKKFNNNLYKILQ